MSMDNPGGDVVLPAELQKRIDLTKKQVAINEQELIILQKARIAEEYAVRELLKRKESTEREIEVAEKAKESITAENAALHEKNIGLAKKNKELVAEFDILVAKNEKEREFTDEREQEVARRETKVADREHEATLREHNCQVQELKNGKFKAKLNEALKEL